MSKAIFYKVTPETLPKETRPPKKQTLELLKEEILKEFEVKVVMQKNEELKYIEVYLEDLVSERLESGRTGFHQYPPTWNNDYADGPAMASEYYEALVAWVKGGRKGKILPFAYPQSSK